MKIAMSIEEWQSAGHSLNCYRDRSTLFRGQSPLTNDQRPIVVLTKITDNHECNSDEEAARMLRFLRNHADGPTV